MHENDFGTVIIDISDNGVGIPAGIDIGTTESLGMSLIKVLSEQLKGRLVLDRTGGTHYNISFERS
jgi:two-component sensor histidine kinase